MIIRKIHIENYLCYYDTNSFELSEGLNIILSENGEGKTKFFEAVDWLFNGENNELDQLVSAKKLDETVIGKSFMVKASIEVEQYGEISLISRSFVAKKEKENECSTSSFMTKGIEENSSGERTQVDGKELLDRVFPFQIRKYSMFKGESELNIFESHSALTNLINLFSEAKHYDKYSTIGAYLREKAEKAVEANAKLDKKNEGDYKRLNNEIASLLRDQNMYKVHLGSTEKEITKIEGHLQLAESHVNNAEALETQNKRIKKINEKISEANSRIDENYTTSLFDEQWILVNFESFHKDFSAKVSAHSKKRRELQSEFDRQKGRKESEAELLNNAVPLPIGTPSKSHMEEMLHDEICKVCNREAKKDSESYKFMSEKLELYNKSLVAEVNEQEKDDPLFKFDYTIRLSNLSISHEDNLKNLRLIRTKIKDVFEFNKTRKQKVSELQQKLESEEEERDRILGNSTIAQEKLSSIHTSYNAWQTDLRRRYQEQVDHTEKLKNITIKLGKKNDEKDLKDTKSASPFLITTKNTLRDIETIFIDTKDQKFDEFIEKIQTKSNNFLNKINIDAFTGKIIFVRRKKVNHTAVEIELQEDGRVFHFPNTSLLTSVHISILFAISELASEIKEENFPMILDAPTSSFGENKTAKFLNLLFETKNQKILLMKDFVHTDEVTQKLSIKSEFDNVKRDKAFWVKLERPFDGNILKTINSQVITL
jgi:DNA sulfur modification protein DndD